MLIKVFAHGKGGGHPPTNYLLRMDYHGRDERPPEVLRGDPDITRDVIDSIDREWKFTAGVCSWSGEDTVTKEQEQEVIERFESVAFAGLEHDQYDILWVRHSHANHHELHFVIPRMELSTGKAFNAFPPRWEKDFGQLRDYLNIKHEWTRPDDPERKRMFTPSNADIIEARLTRWGQNPTNADKDNVRKEINNFIQGRIENGLIQDRAEIISTLQEVGIQINREGKYYISVKDPDSNFKIRLKGYVYEHKWTAANTTRKASTESGARTGSNKEVIRRELTELEQGLTEVIRKRAVYNEKRYPSRDTQDIKEIEWGSSFTERDIPKLMGKEFLHRDCTNGRDVHKSTLLGGVGDRRIEREISNSIPKDRGIERPKEPLINDYPQPQHDRGSIRRDMDSRGRRRDVCNIPDRDRLENDLGQEESSSSKIK